MVLFMRLITINYFYMMRFTSYKIIIKNSLIKHHYI